jgi:anaerobic selenocysteine-containing dehydrogenase
LPAYTPHAQPTAPFKAWGYGEQMRVRGLTMAACGLPTAALSDEILLDGEGQVKALICVGANPVMAWPDQRRTIAAMEKLELLVCTDNEMSATAQFADYVIAPRLSFETAGMSQAVETLKYYGFGLGYPRPWGQYAPPIAEPPEGSELIEDWLFFHGLARRMGLELQIKNAFRAGSHAEAASIYFTLDPHNPPSTEEFYAEFTRNARIPLEEVNRHPNGRIFDEADGIVLPREADNMARLQIGDPHMTAELEEILAEDYRALRTDDEFPFLFVSRRANNFMNSIGRTLDKLTAGRGYNPAFLHPDDLAALGIASGESIEVRSAHDAIRAVAEADDTLRRGVVAITHGFGGTPADDDRHREIGCNTGRLMAADVDYDPITGIPRMSALPVAIARLLGG